MNNSNKNINRQFNGSFPVDRKKTVLAIGLLVLMVMMWVRVFASKSTPQTAQAADLVYQQSESSKVNKTPTNVQYVKMPFVMGRNDKITSNFFDISRWPEFTPSTTVKADKTVFEAEKTNDANKESIVNQLELALDNVDLKAVIAAEQCEAFIDTEIYRVGDKLRVVYENSEYVLEIVSINSDGVRLGFGDVELVKRISGSADEAGEK